MTWNKRKVKSADCFLVCMWLLLLRWFSKTLRNWSKSVWCFGFHIHIQCWSFCIRNISMMCRSVSTGRQSHTKTKTIALFTPHVRMNECLIFIHFEKNMNFLFHTLCFLTCIFEIWNFFVRIQFRFFAFQNDIHTLEFFDFFKCDARIETASTKITQSNCNHPILDWQIHGTMTITEPACKSLPIRRQLNELCHENVYSKLLLKITDLNGHTRQK